MFNTHNYYANESVDNLVAVMTVLEGGGAIPTAFAISSFADGQDIYSISDYETADAVSTPDRRIKSWKKNSLVEGTFNLSGSSEAGLYLSQLMNSAEVVRVNLTITNPNSGILNITDMILTTGKNSEAYGNERLAPKNFTFKYLPKNTVFIPFVI